MKFRHFQPDHRPQCDRSVRANDFLRWPRPVPSRNNSNPSYLVLIQRLAEETHSPVEIVARLYHGIFASLETGATVRTFLPVLAAKKVKQQLRRSPAG